MPQVLFVQQRNPSSVKAKPEAQQSHCSRSPELRKTHSIGFSAAAFLSKLSHKAFLSILSAGFNFFVRLLPVLPLLLTLALVLAPVLLTLVLLLTLVGDKLFM